MSKRRQWWQPYHDPCATCDNKDNPGGCEQAGAQWDENWKRWRITKACSRGKKWQ